MKTQKHIIYVRFFIISFTVILLDYISKKWMLSLLFDVPQQIIITGFFNLTPVWNNGVSFGFMASQPEIIRLIILPGRRPSEEAASVCPCEIANIPERTISPMKAEV